MTIPAPPWACTILTSTRHSHTPMSAKPLVAPQHGHPPPHGYPQGIMTNHQHCPRPQGKKHQNILK